jgi:hypothetical protein
LQIDLLRNRYGKNGLHPYLDQLIQAFEFVSKSGWYLKTDTGYRVCHFTRGQPLGLQPSFAVFALTHNVMLEGICDKLGRRPMDCFRILGDDIVICDPEVHRLYRSTLRNLGCKVSESKTLESSLMAEFAGCIITRSMIGHAYKWKTPTWDNFISLCETYGPKARQLMWGAQRKVVDALAPIPTIVGGFGWNPEGIPLSKRLDSDLARFLLSIDKGKTLCQYRTLTSLIRRFENQLTEAGLVNNGYMKTLNVDPWSMGAKGLSTREAKNLGWSNEAVISSLQERDFGFSIMAPDQETVFLPALPDGHHSSWVQGIGVVIYNGQFSHDPRNSMKRQLYEVLKAGLIQAQASVKEMEAFKRFLAGERRQKPAKSFREVQATKPAVPKKTKGIRLH